MERDHWRLGLHLMPPQGWLNDPNGLCWYQGEYHVFFQYSPDDANGGLKHWGHYKSKDMLTWEFTGIPVKAEEEYEKDGAYSGCAFVENDVMHLFYTGNVKEDGDFDYITAGRGHNVIHAVYTPEGELKDKECILRNADYPAYYTCHVRDPKVWKEGGTYYMVLGGRDVDDNGKVLVYISSNLTEWSFLQDITAAEDFGFMWECPDYMTVDGTQILSLSPQGVETRGHDFENIYQSGYFTVKGSVTGDYELQNFTEWDHGFDFYAPQTFEDQNGRRILIGWMGIPDADYTNPTIEQGWQHALTIPRVLVNHDGVIYQQPIEELESLRGDVKTLTDGEAAAFDLAEIQIENILDEDICITVANGMEIRYAKDENCVTMRFTDDKVGCGRKIRHCDVDDCRHMRIILDSSAVEIYINHGEKVMTSRYYPAEGENTVNVVGGKAKMWALSGYRFS